MGGRGRGGNMRGWGCLGGRFGGFCWLGGIRIGLDWTGCWMGLDSEEVERI